MKRFWTIRVFAGLILTGIVPFCGCVAVNVGTPKVYTHTETHFETGTCPSATHVEMARAQMNQTGTRLSVGIAADVQEEYPKLRWDETATIRVQKRLGIGLFPGASEVYLSPKGALHPALFRSRVGTRLRDGVRQGVWRDPDAPDGQVWAVYDTSEGNYVAEHFLSLFVLGLSQVGGTIYSLLIEPFAGYSCDHDFIEEECLEIRSFPNEYLGKYADATASPKIRVFKSFSPEERKQMGIMTCYDYRPQVFSSAGFSHLALIGCHKHQAVFVDPPKSGSRTETGEVETKRSRVDVEGPYVAELAIPAMEYTREVRVDKGATRAEFVLPAAARKCVAEAVVRIRAGVAGEVSKVTKGALEKMAGEEYRFDVTLEGGGEAVPATVPKAAGGAYEVVGITPSGNGRYEVRVRIADKSKTFDIGWAVEPDVKRMIREDFVKRHPGTGIQYVREVVEWETEEDGAILVYRGWAFSARPVSDGWKYDDESRKGTVRLRISEGMPAEEAKQWARDNIEAIVKEKNVALEAGRPLPDGATYRSLSETLEDGVLTVEFEAVE